jgi:hypothetical protein
LGAALPHNTSLSAPLPTVVETSAFTRRAGKLLTAEEYEELIVYLAQYRETGDEIPGTGGVRKLRFAAFGRGKSGGVRAIYYFYEKNTPLHAIFLYGKNEQVDLNPAQKKQVKAFAATVKAAALKERSAR